MENLKIKKNILGKFRNNIKILSTRNLLCRKFLVSVGKLQLPARLLFTRDSRMHRAS